jgi:hypothetical protein
MIQRWQEKSIHNPLNIDRDQEEEHRASQFEYKRKIKAIDKWKQRVIDGNVPGVKKFDPVPKSKISVFDDPEVQLSLQLRGHDVKLAEVQKAKSLVEQLMHSEVKTLSKKFSSLSSVFDNVQYGVSDLGRASPLRASEHPRSKAGSHSERSTTKKNTTARSDIRNLASSIQSSSTTGNYHSPGSASLEQFEDDLNAQFGSDYV